MNPFYIHIWLPQQHHDIYVETFFLENSKTYKKVSYKNSLSLSVLEIWLKRQIKIDQQVFFFQFSKRILINSLISWFWDNVKRLFCGECKNLSKKSHNMSLCLADYDISMKSKIIIDHRWFLDFVKLYC